MTAAIWLVLTGCTSSDTKPLYDYLDEGDYVIDNSHANVITSFHFFGMDEEGYVDGLDLDGIVSESGDEETCGHGDLTNANGITGIDNQFGKLWNTVGPALGAGSGLLQGAINEGRVILMIELKDVDDLLNDDDVTVSVFPAIADPIIGSFGTIASNQTYYVNPESVLSTVAGVEIIDGELIAGPFEFSMPISILEADFETVVRKAKVRAKIEENGSMSGIIGFALDVDQVLEEALQTDAAEEFLAVEPIFRFNADMSLRDGECEQFSVGWAFEGTSGFVVRTEQVEVE